MSYSIKKRRGSKDVDNLLKHLKTIAETHIQVGYFSDTGNHSGAEIPYAELMHSLELNLSDQFQVGYPALQVGGNDIVTKPTPTFISEVKELIVDVGQSSQNIEPVAKEAREIVYDVFGDGTKLPVTSNPTPLVDTGELRAALTYKIE